MATQKSWKKATAAAIAAGIAAYADQMGWDPTAVLTVISPLLVYILGQGIADHGKSAAQVNGGGSGPAAE